MDVSLEINLHKEFLPQVTQHRWPCAKVTFTQSCDPVSYLSGKLYMLFV